MSSSQCVRCEDQVARRRKAVLLALAADAWVGDPPNSAHPVAWMGSLIGILKRAAPADSEAARFMYGGVVAVGGGLVMASAGKTLEWLFCCLPEPLGILLEAAVLKMMLAARGLGQAAEAIEGALARGDLPEARRLVNWHLVSRDTSRLSTSQVAAAAIESVAENTSDGVVGPLFYYLTAGLPGALAYRYLNTCDSMLGYRDSEHEWLGKIPARLDDAANLVPARLTAAGIILVEGLQGGHVERAVRVWQRDRKLTASPNAGHPMSAMAGAVGVELEKVGHYCLGGGQRKPEVHDIGRTVKRMRRAVAVVTGFLLVCSLIRKRTHRE